MPLFDITDEDQKYLGQIHDAAENVKKYLRRNQRNQCLQELNILFQYIIALSSDGDGHRLITKLACFDLVVDQICRSKKLESHWKQQLKQFYRREGLPVLPQKGFHTFDLLRSFIYYNESVYAEESAKEDREKAKQSKRHQAAYEKRADFYVRYSHDCLQVSRYLKNFYALYCTWFGYLNDLDKAVERVVGKPLSDFDEEDKATVRKSYRHCQQRLFHLSQTGMPETGQPSASALSAYHALAIINRIFSEILDPEICARYKVAPKLLLTCSLFFIGKGLNWLGLRKEAIPYALKALEMFYVAYYCYLYTDGDEKVAIHNSIYGGNASELVQQIFGDNCPDWQEAEKYVKGLVHNVAGSDINVTHLASGLKLQADTQAQREFANHRM